MFVPISIPMTVLINALHKSCKNRITSNITSISSFQLRQPGKVAQPKLQSIHSEMSSTDKAGFQSNCFRGKVFVFPSPKPAGSWLHWLLIHFRIFFKKTNKLVYKLVSP